MASRIMMSCALLVQGNQENGAFFAPVWEESTGSADLQPRRLMVWPWSKANPNCHKRTEAECKSENFADECQWDETDEDKSKHKCVPLTKEQKAEIAKKKAAEAKQAAEEKKAAEEAKKAAEEAKKAAEEAKKAGEPIQDVETEPTEEIAVPGEPTEEIAVPGEPTEEIAVPGEPTEEIAVPGEPTEEIAVPGEPTQEIVVPGEPTQDVETEPTQEIAIPEEPTQEIAVQQADDAQNQDNAAGQAQTEEEKEKKTDSAGALSAIFPLMVAMLQC